MCKSDFEKEKIVMTTEKRIRMIRLLDKMARNEGYTKKLKLENVSDWNRYRKGGKTMGKSIWDKIKLPWFLLLQT